MLTTGFDRSRFRAAKTKDSILTRRFMTLFHLPFIAFVSLLLGVPATRANDVYVAQSAASSNTGVGCANARAVSSLGAGDWVAGNTIHLCGVISSAVTAQGSGTSGNPVTLYFESGSKISLPYCPASGCLNLQGVNYIVVDGGVPCGPAVKNKSTCQGIIEANANGTGLANQDPQGTGIMFGSSTNIEVKNLIGQNFYVRTSTSDLAPSAPLPGCIGFANGASQIKVHDSTFHDALWCMNVITGASVVTNVYLYNIETYNTGHAYAVGVGAQTDDSIYIYNNYDHDHANWDSSGCAYHNDGIHAYQVSGGNVTNLYAYNNVWSGNWGNCTSAVLYTEGIAMTYTVFNNVALLQNTPTQPGNGCYTITVGTGGTSRLYNNTCIMGSSATVYDVKWEGATDIQNNATANTTQILTVLPTDVTVPTGSMIDYNAWGADPNSQSWYQSSSSAYLTFPQWQSYLKSAYPSSGGDAHGMAYTSPANLGLDSTGHLQSGSPLIGKGHNLSALCNGQANPGIGALCFDAAGNARAGGSANWDIGAYSSGTTATQIAPPTSLTAAVQ
jgi:hypothetical protein